MLSKTKTSEVVFDLVPRIERRLPRPYPCGERSASLPFTIQFARTQAPFQDLKELRVEAYSQHYPELADFLEKDDFRDWQDGSFILFAECKETKKILGTLRAIHNFDRPLQYEREVALPKSLQGQIMAGVSRFVVARGAYSLQVKYALIKAMYLYMVAHQIRFVILAAMPPTDRLYARLGFKWIFQNKREHSLTDFPNPVVLMSVKTDSFARSAKHKNPGFYSFIFGFRHPDIKIFESVQNSKANPRRL
jgi:hypothetical protein